MNLTIQTPFTEGQLELLSLFKTNLNATDMQELRDLLLAFKFRKFQATIEQVVTEKGYTEKDFEAMGQAHNRTPYKSYQKHNQIENQ
jgi:hypothetical protein